MNPIATHSFISQKNKTLPFIVISVETHTVTTVKTVIYSYYLLTVAASFKHYYIIRIIISTSIPFSELF